MAFMQANVNYAEEFGRILDEIFPYESYYADLWNQGNGLRYMPVTGKTFKIPSGTVSGARNTNRNRIDGVFTRNMNNDWQTVDLQMDREWDTLADPMDTQETNGVLSIPNAVRLFTTTQKIPEMNAFASSKIAQFAGQFGGVDTTTLDSSNILAMWDSYLEYLTNQRVNRDTVRCKMTPAIYKLLKEAAGITRFVDLENGFRGIDRNVARLDGVFIQEVPADMMKDAYDFTEGWDPAAGSHQINLLMYSPLSLAAPVKYEVAMMGAPTAQSKGKALYYERFYYGMFALSQKQAGLFVNLGSAPTLGTLTVTSAAGTAAGSSNVTVSGSQVFDSGNVAYGLDLYYSTGNNAAVSLTYGAALPNGATWVKATGNPIALTSQTASKHCTVALVNRQTGLVVAGGDTTLVVGV